jgi:5-methyltetrahydrofolate--homocysteine methyltransferase
VEHVDLDEIYPFVNRVALFRGQWQYKKGKKSDAEYEAQVKNEVEPLFKRLQEQCRDERILRPRVVYGYLPCASDGEDVVVFDPEDRSKEVERFRFPRQRGRQQLCIADFFRSIDGGPEQRDVLGLSCVTMGEEVSHRCRKLFDDNQYAEYLFLHGMGVECAEGLAELWHKRMRMELGIGDEDSPRIKELFTQHYRGSRYSFGYPACPEMSDQDKLFRLLKPERIGCRLTENWQIEPEQSTSAIVVHHPEAKYFSV